MAITREDLNNLYLKHLEEKKIKNIQLCKTEVDYIKSEILRINKLGKKIFTSVRNVYDDYYYNELLKQLKEIFIDCIITSEMTESTINNIDTMKQAKITIDWNLL